MLHKHKFSQNYLLLFPIQN